MSDFRQHQQRFAAHIRDPQQNPLPDDVEDRRMAIYRDLFFNNVNGFLSNSFPVLKSLLDDDQWLALARGFFASHASESPLFAEIPQEFIAYLQSERPALDTDPPFLLELAHYEWVEMAVAISNADDDQLPVDPNGDLLTAHPVLTPVMFNLSYHYPVHQIGPDFQPAKAPDELTHLVVFRNRQDEVKFLEINAVTQQLIEALKQNPSATGLDVLKGIAEALQHPDPNVVIEAGTSLLYDLRHQDVIIGTGNPDTSDNP